MKADVCPCHGEAWLVTKTQRRCVVNRRESQKRASARYDSTLKGVQRRAREEFNRDLKRAIERVEG